MKFYLKLFFQIFILDNSFIFGGKKINKKEL